MIELWHEWNSVHSFKVRVVLAEKALAWTDRTIELLKFEHLQPAYLRLNPAGVVPTLVHQGRVLTESSVICQYLDEISPVNPLLPADSLGRARARTWLKHFDDVVHPALRKASFELLYRNVLRSTPREELAARLKTHPDPKRAQAFLDSAAGEMNGSAVAEARQSFATTLQCVDVALRDDPWLGGASFGLADAAMAPMIERLNHLEMGALLDASLPVHDWSNRILARPSVVHSRAPDRYRLTFIKGKE
jgi:glutathione S-transferase